MHGQKQVQTELESSDESSLLQLIQVYLDAVRRAVARLKECFGPGCLLEGWRLGKVPRLGKLGATQTVRYEFHGVGCRVVFGEVVVDFDFGPNGRTDGFDLWRLGLFLEDNKLTGASRLSRDALRGAFESLERKGVISCPKWEPSPHLYYLVAPGRAKR